MKTTTILGAAIDVVPQPDGSILKVTELATGDTTLIPMDTDLSAEVGKKLSAPRVALPHGNGRPELN